LIDACRYSLFKLTIYKPILISSCSRKSLQAQESLVLLKIFKFFQSWEQSNV